LAAVRVAYAFIRALNNNHVVLVNNGITNIRSNLRQDSMFMKSTAPANNISIKHLFPASVFKCPLLRLIKWVSIKVLGNKILSSLFKEPRIKMGSSQARANDAECL